MTNQLVAEHPDGRGPDPFPDDHPFAPLRSAEPRDLRLLQVRNAHLGATSVIGLVGDPLGSIAPLVHLHRGLHPGHGRDPRAYHDTRDLIAAYERLRVDGAGVLIYHRDDGPGTERAGEQPAPPAPRPLGVLETSPALVVLAATIAGLRLAPARLLVPAHHDPGALDPRAVGLRVVRTAILGPGRPPSTTGVSRGARPQRVT